MTKAPKVLIVILNYITFDLTLKLIDDLQRQLNYENYKILVVDNCSPNESAEVLERLSKDKEYIFIKNNKNTGYAAGNNIGLRYAVNNNFKYSWILNNDIELREKSILINMINILEKNNQIAAIGPKIYTIDNRICAPYCSRPSFWNMTLGIFADKKYRDKHTNISGIVYRLHGCCMLLKNTALKEIDFMDERTFLYGEEAILAERLLSKGYRTYYLASVSITHMESISIAKISDTKLKFQLQEQEKSRELYLREYRHFSKIERVICHLAKKIILYLK